jgi:hypothetical protein
VGGGHEGRVEEGDCVAEDDGGEEVGESRAGYVTVVCWFGGGRWRWGFGEEECAGIGDRRGGLLEWRHGVLRW